MRLPVVVAVVVVGWCGSRSRSEFSIGSRVDEATFINPYPYPYPYPVSTQPVPIPILTCSSLNSPGCSRSIISLSVDLMGHLSN